MKAKKMKKQNIKTQLLQVTSGGMYINLTQLQKYLSAGKAYTRDIVRGLDYWENGKEKRYNIDDVVQALWNERRVSDVSNTTY